MNKRLKKKKINHAITNIQKLNLNDNEFLVFRFDKEKWKPKDICEFATRIKQDVSNRILFIFNDIEMIKVTEK